MMRNDGLTRRPQSTQRISGSFSAVSAVFALIVVFRFRDSQGAENR